MGVWVGVLPLPTVEVELDDGVDVEFEFELDASELEMVGGKEAGKKRTEIHLPELISVSVSELTHPLMVRVKERSAV